MKRISVLFTIVFLYSLVSQAQFKIAITGGPHQSKVIEENNLPGWDSLKNQYSGRNGIHFGFMANLRFTPASNFYFQPSVTFYNKGRNYKSSARDTAVVIKRPLLPDSILNTNYYQTRKQFTNYIDLPFNIVYKITLGKKVNFILGVGPYLSFFYNGFDNKYDIITDVSVTSEENTDLPVGKGPGKYSIIDYGINSLAGFEFGRVFVTANYSRGLNDFYKPADYTISDYKHEVMGATLGIFFGKPDLIKPADKDGDGTPDKLDKCPDLAGPSKFLGCPDTDTDGIPDSEDKCPGEAGLASNKGCPVKDKDGDEILDIDDKCPELAGPKDNQGCPFADRDKDGIIDKDDKCPDVAGLGRYQGCPVPDTDGDGINDEEDQCPAAKGFKAKNGCPEEVKKDIIEKVDFAAKRIQFKVSSAELLPVSFQVLDKIAEILIINPDINVLIEGHTSRDGTYEANMLLSEQRANKVRDYLLLKGIDAARLSSKGLGPDKPLNEGKTAEEKAKNRRVELKLSN